MLTLEIIDETNLKCVIKKKNLSQELDNLWHNKKLMSLHMYLNKGHPAKLILYLIMVIRHYC
jgi:hypothetical protein